MKITKRRLQLSLGFLWLLDGGLQLQHQMFSKAFITQVIDPAAQGQPVVVAGPMHFFIHIFLWNPVLLNSLAAIVQLSIGALILWPRTARLGLIASVFWGLFVWYIGEGLGGLLSGQTSILMGAPGAALLYVLLAWSAWPNQKDIEEETYPAVWLTVVWMGLWVMGAIYQLLPGQDSLSDLSGMISGNASGAPGWLAALDRHTANAVNGISPATAANNMHMTAAQMAQMSGPTSPGYEFVLAFALIMVMIGFGVFASRGLRRVALVIGIVLLLLFWAVGQSLAGYWTGLATDPNTAPLFILLGICLLGNSKLDAALHRLYAKTERAIL